ncbi:hypothetical protein pb186bvf_005087 [Paramecium bursaria]
MSKSPQSNKQSPVHKPIKINPHAKKFGFFQINDNFEYVLKYALRTKRGIINGHLPKINQDSYVICTNIGRKSYMHFFAVCDGHGQYGHIVSNFLKTVIPNLINQNKELLEKNPITGLTQIFEQISNKITKANIDLSFSGSTIVSIFMLHNKIYCANLGDSRAITIKQPLEVIQLSRDHKPSCQDESERVINSGGRIDQFKDNQGNRVGPLRVWMNNEVPGLAMTRSVGDQIAKLVGVSDIPEIKTFTIQKSDKILLLGSDGLFEFLQNQEIMNIIVPFFSKDDLDGACNKLMNEACNSWMQRTTIMDDITFIMIFMTY